MFIKQNYFCRPKMSLSTLSPFAYDASTSPFLIHHTINVPWKLYKPQVWSGPSSLLYTNNIIGNFTTVFVSKKYDVNHAICNYSIIVKSPCYYALSTSYADTSSSAFNNLYESLACHLLTY